MSTRKRQRSGGRLSRRLFGLALLTLGVYLALALRERGADWWGVLHGEPWSAVWRGGARSGPLGGVTAFVVHAVLGAVWAWFLPAWLVWRGAAHLWRGADLPRYRWETRLWLLVLASAAWLGCPGGPAGSVAQAARLGGVLGFYLAGGVTALAGRVGAQLFLGLGALAALLLVLEPGLGPVARLLGWCRHGLAVAGRGAWDLLRRGSLALTAAAREGGRRLTDSVATLFAGGEETEPEAEPEEWSEAVATAAGTGEEHGEPDIAWEEEEPAGTGEPEEVAVAAPAEPEMAVSTRRRRRGGSVSVARRRAGAPTLPPLDLLVDPEPPRGRLTEEHLRESAAMLEEKLRTFGVEGKVRQVRPGPVVTTYEFKPAPGVTVNAVVRRADDLALAMSARSIRIRAPLPGTDAVGIEIPNPVQEMVRLKEVVQAAGDLLRHPLDVALGRDVFGKPVVIDLAAQPHLLVAGATGSGKSVCINAMLVSLLLRCPPETVRLLLIDPKMLELNAYNGIPHLLHPVITDPRAALRAMKWLEAEMDQRYRRLARHGVRNIEGYNRKVAAGEIAGPDGEPVTEPMPYYLCIVDELADLMMQLGQEIELPITRLAQKARAIGIHLILATQRPSVDVLTGVIKANIPCRIAFRVIQRNDSRTILDANGAEKLLGKGDMLYLQPGEAKPVRVHGAFVDVTECEAVASHWREQGLEDEPIDLDEGSGEADGGEELEMDPLFERAREIVVLSQHGSTSMLQRKLGVGYARAGRLMDLLERHGVVGPFVGSKAREVLLKPDDLRAMEADAGGDPA